MTNIDLCHGTPESILINISKLPSEINILLFSPPYIYLKYLTDIKIHRLILNSIISKGNGLKYLNSKNINEIVLNQAKNVNDCDLKYLCNFKTITLNNACDITDAGLKNLSDVDNITLINCPNITNRGLRYLVNVQTKFKMENCPKTSIDGMKHIVAKCIDLQLINTFNDHDLKYLGNVDTIILSANVVISNVEMRYLSRIKNVHFGNFGKKFNTTGGDMFKFFNEAEEFHFIGCYPSRLGAIELIMSTNVKSIFIKEINITSPGAKYLLSSGFKIIDCIDGFIKIERFL